MIKLQNIEKEYLIKNGKTTKAIQDISLEIGNKGLVFILGKSGSGKTTLLNLIGGLDIYNKGSIYINGINTKTLTEHELDLYRREQVGFIFQEHNLLSTYTIGKNLSLALELQGVEAKESDVNLVLGKMDLVGFQDRYPDEMSTGQKQRVAIARAIIKKPNLIIADEPTGSLDSETGKVNLDLLKHLSKDKLVLVVTHDANSAYEYGDRVIEISDGSIVKDTICKKENISNSEDLNSKLNKSYDTFTQDKRNRLKYLDVVTLSMKNLFMKKYRLIFTLLLCTVAFTLFGVADTIANYDADNALLQSLNVVDRRYVTLKKEMKYFDENSGEGYVESPSFTIDEMVTLRNTYIQNNFYEVFFNYNSHFGTEVNNEKLYEYESSYGRVFNLEISGATELNQEFLDDTGTVIIAGRLPLANIEDNEIVITEYLFETFKKFDIEQGSEYAEITSYDDIIGKTLYEYEIVGVIDTGFNFERYLILDESSNIDTDHMRNVSFEMNNILDYGIHNYIFFREGYYDDVLSNQDVLLIGSLRLSSKITNKHLSLGQVNSVTSIEDLLNDVFTLNNVQITELQDNEIIIPFDMLPKFGEPGFTVLDTYTNMNDNITTEIHRLITEFAIINYEIVEENFEIDFGESSYEDYIDYIYTNDFNLYQDNYNIDYFTYLARSEILDSNLFDKLIGLEVGEFDNFGYLSEDIEFKIVGVYFPDNPKENIDDDRATDNPVIMSDEMIEHVDNDIGIIIVTLSDNSNENLVIINEGKEEVNEEFIGVDYILNSEYKTMINYAGGYISFTSTILVAVGGLFAVFSSLLLFNFIGTSIRLKQKDIGILRSMGASSVDVFKIFSIESLLIGLLCFLLSLTFTIPIVMIFDKVLQTQFSVPVSFVFVTLRQVVLLFVISTLVSLVATIVPIYNFSRKRPIDIIKKASL